MTGLWARDVPPESVGGSCTEVDDFCAVCNAAVVPSVIALAADNVRVVCQRNKLRHTLSRNIAIARVR
jgi:hypothetical protein